MHACMCKLVCTSVCKPMFGSENSSLITLHLFILRQGRSVKPRACQCSCSYWPAWSRDPVSASWGWEWQRNHCSRQASMWVLGNPNAPLLACSAACALSTEQFLESSTWTFWQKLQSMSWVSRKSLEGDKKGSVLAMRMAGQEWLFSLNLPGPNKCPFTWAAWKEHHQVRHENVWWNHQEL